MLAESEILNFISVYMKRNKNPDDRLVRELISRNLLVQTDDGTYTVRSTAGSELMHSRMGALREAFEKFAIPSGINKIINPTILDLCSGLGYNSLAALVTNPSSSIHMIEYSREMIFLGACLESEYNEKKIIDKAVYDFLNDRKNEKIKIINGDAREAIAHISESLFDVVFHDGFSPANDPVLYSVEFLKVLKSKMKSTGLLLSYSSSLPFRSALIEAGFSVGRGPAIGRKRGITLAAVNPEDKRLFSRLKAEDEKMIALTTVGYPYRDSKLDLTGEQISIEREVKREEMRKSGKYLSAKKIKKHNTDPVYDRISSESSDSATAIRLMNKYLLTNNRN
jgi:tRNA U34 5-methylaminomethyl-2-thiouridine-forming methyltransferase MnmC